MVKSPLVFVQQLGLAAEQLYADLQIENLIWRDVEYSLESTSSLQPCKQNHGLCQPFEPAMKFQVLRLWFLHVHTSGCAK